MPTKEPVPPPPPEERPQLPPGVASPPPPRRRDAPRFYAYRAVSAEQPQAMSDMDKTINDLVSEIHKENADAGWWPAEAKENPLCVPAKLALIHSEVSEAMEGFRRNLRDDKLLHRSMFEAELADAVIRIFDLAGAYEIPLGTVIEEKRAFNRTREDHKPEARSQEHGKKF